MQQIHSTAAAPMSNALALPPSWAAGLHAAAAHLRHVPGVAVTATAAGMVLVVAYGMRLRAKTATELPALARARKPQIRGRLSAFKILGLAGMTVSLYGLYGFATHTAELPRLFAVGFMCIFDLAELACFMSLYRQAEAAPRWTTSMRRTRRMAWTLVACSAAMNAAHAPGNVIAELVLAAVPVISARLIEHDLDTMLEENRDAAAVQQPGPFPLVKLLWAKWWAEAFARLELDAEAVDGQIPQQARIRRAARLLAELGRTLEHRERDEYTNAKPKARQKADRQLEDLRGRTQAAVDAAGVAQDDAAMLDMTRRLVTRDRVDDLATMDRTKPLQIMALLEELRIVPSVAALTEGARAAQARAERQAAEEARDAALKERAEAEAEAARLIEEATALLAQARSEKATARTREENSQRLAEEAQTAAQQAQEAVRQAEEKQAKAEAEAARAAARLQELQTDATVTASQRQQAADELAALREALTSHESRVAELRQQEEKARREAQDAAARNRAAAEEAARLARQVDQLAQQSQKMQQQLTQQAEERSRHMAALDDLTRRCREAEAAARREVERAAAAKQAADAAEQERRMADVALQEARDDLLDALTNPEAAQAPQWRSQAKRDGWEVYERTIRTEGRPPTAEELAAATGRDRTTAQHWLRDFGAELARRTAERMPEARITHQRSTDADSRTGRTAMAAEDRTPAMV